MPPKRKTAATRSQDTDSTGSKSTKRSASSAEPASKKPKSDRNVSTIASFIDRRYYPAEMTNARCEMYNRGELPRPMDALHEKMAETREARDAVQAGGAVLHWFKRDLRLFDNRGLGMASRVAKEAGVPLVCLYVVSPQDFEAHVTSAARVDFELRTLEILKRDLAELDIPLLVETVAKRKTVPDRIVDLCAEFDIKHVFCNIEYEVDELRREVQLIEKCLDNDISFNPVHDDVIVAPGTLQTGAGKQYAVYTPWFRSWIKYLHANPEQLEASEIPAANPKNARRTFKAIFAASIPAVPMNKVLTPADRKRFAALWPAGEHEAQSRLKKFLDERVPEYANKRNFPASNGTATLSVHHSVGTLAARTSVRMARDANSTTKKLDGGSSGIATWISEVAWRDFYKHVLAHWPYVCMAKPFKYEYANVEWEWNDEHFQRWCQGQTGFPIVDAAMRQLKHMGYMHNRCRMIVGSFLAKDLLLDWRLGEKYFMETLIDGDFASNNGGWGFSASTGVDPQPYFRIFNPLLQSEKFDSSGEYIRTWVPELRDVVGNKAIHDPYGRGQGDVAERNGYPRGMVVHGECRERALGRYKAVGRRTG